MIGQIHKIKLVFPPISNQTAEWLKEDDEIIQLLKSSKLYMICQRPEIFFDFTKIDKNELIKYGLNGFIRENTTRTSFNINIQKFIETYPTYYSSINDFGLECGDKIIKFWSRRDDEIVNWWTVEKLLYDFSIGCSFISGIKKHSYFTKYFVHYIGISIENDSLTRLVVKPHDKRIKILSNENTFCNLSRLTDELILFFFDVRTLETKVLDYNDIESFVNGLGKYTVQKDQIILDVEKALIKIMNSEYNTIKYSQYPVSSDGLFPTNVDRYTYFFGDSYEFMTDTTSIIGNYVEHDIDMENKADFIAVDKESVTLFKGNGKEKDV